MAEKAPIPYSEIKRNPEQIVLDEVDRLSNLSSDDRDREINQALPLDLREAVARRYIKDKTGNEPQRFLEDFGITLEGDITSGASNEASIKVLALGNRFNPNTWVVHLVPNRPNSNMPIFLTGKTDKGLIYNQMRPASLGITESLSDSYIHTLQMPNAAFSITLIANQGEIFVGKQ